MKKLNYYIMVVSLSMIALFFLEGITTLGSAFKFEDYSIFGWIAQGVIIVFTISLAIHIAGIEYKED